MHAGLNGGPTISLKGAREGRPQPASARPEAFSALRSSQRPSLLAQRRPERHGLGLYDEMLLTFFSAARADPAYPRLSTALRPRHVGNIHFTSIRRSPLNATPSHSRCSSSARHREITLSNSSRVDARSGDVVTAQLTLLRAFDRRSVSTIDVGSIQNIACASFSKSTTACLARLRLGLPGQLGAIEPALQGGHGISPPPQVQPPEPSNGRSGCLSQTQPMPLHNGHAMAILPLATLRS